MCIKTTAFCCVILLLSINESIRGQVALVERMTNFTLELLFHTMTVEGDNSNLILSPVSIWGLLFAISGGSRGKSRLQINMAIRMKTSDNSLNRETVTYLRQLAEKSSAAFDIQKLNAILEDKDILPLQDFAGTSMLYGIDIAQIAFSNPNEINQQLSTYKSEYPFLKLFSLSDIKPNTLLPLTAFNLNGEWVYRFDSTFTTEQPFYDTKGKFIGNVNMMYNRHTYAVTSIDSFKARALEIPYANGSFSMIILLPKKDVSLKEVLYGFTNSSFDTIIQELNTVKNLREEILAVIPRFHIRSNLDMKPVLNLLGIYDIFIENTARLPLVARTPTYVNKFIHNVEIDVTEIGTKTSEAMRSVIGTRVGVASFVANKPFLYFIVEKSMNSMVFCGQYQVPVIY